MEREDIIKYEAGGGNGGGQPADLGGDPAATDPAAGDIQDNPAGEGRPDFNAPSASAAGEAGGAGGGTNAARTPADPNNAGWTSIRDAAGQFGYQFGQDVTDDRGALLHLIRQAQRTQESDYYAQLGRQIAPHASLVQQALQQRQAAQAQPQRNEWEPPEFDERWLALVDRDQATGVFLAKPGVAPEVAQKVNEYAEWKARFDRNPAAVLDKLVEQRAQSIARQTVQEQMGQYQAQNVIQQIAAENADWLYQKDEAGRLVVGANGRYVPSPSGARYLDHLRNLGRAGIKDPRTQDYIAKQILAGEHAMAQLASKGGAAQPGAAQVQAGLAAARPNTNALQAQPIQQRRANPVATEPSSAGKSLAEMLRDELAAGGVSDIDFASPGA